MVTQTAKPTQGEPNAADLRSTLNNLPEGLRKKFAKATYDRKEHQLIGQEGYRLSRTARGEYVITKEDK